MAKIRLNIDLELDDKDIRAIYVNSKIEDLFEKLTDYLYEIRFILNAIGEETEK